MSTEILVRMEDNGLEFKGIGAVTSNGMSRLLYDYPEKQREEILDLLFKENYGASLHTLKVEIGSDANGTGGTEPSHMRSEHDFDISRGVGLKMAASAKERNKDISLDALRWGTPSWITDYDKKYLYYLNFLKGAKEHYNLSFDYLSPDENEGDYDIAWVTDILRPRLDRDGFSNVKLSGADSTEEWNIIPLVEGNPDFKASINAINRHYKQDSPDGAKNCGLPIYNSEDLAPFRHDYKCSLEMAYKIIRSYVSGRMVQYVMHPIIESMYDSAPYSCKAILLADQPWSGHYDVLPGLWVTAHFTQFTKPGWKYIDSGCSFSDKVSYLSLKDEKTGDLSIIILNRADSNEKIKLTIDGIENKSLACWITEENSHFNHIDDIQLENRSATIDVPALSICTLTTTSGQMKGTSELQIPENEEFKLPYIDGFSYGKPGDQLRYAVDQGGAFELGLYNGQKCLKQVLKLSEKPIDWERRPTPSPYTILCSQDLTSYKASIKFLVSKTSNTSFPEYVYLGTRCNLAPQKQEMPECYGLRIYTNGRWALYRGFEILSSGKIDNYCPTSWHDMEVSCSRNIISAFCDKTLLTSIKDSDISSGSVVIGSSYTKVFYKDLRVEEIDEDTPYSCSRYPVSDNRIVFSGTWKKEGANSDNYNRTLLSSSKAGDKMSLKFQGCDISLIGIHDSNLGKAKVFIDGEERAEIDEFSYSKRSRRCIFSAYDLSNHIHDLEIIILGKCNPDSTGCAFAINAVETSGALK